MSTTARNVNNSGQYSEGDIHNVTYNTTNNTTLTQEQRNEYVYKLVNFHKSDEHIKKALQMYAKDAFGTALYKTLTNDQLARLMAFKKILLEIKPTGKPKNSVLSAFTRWFK